MSIATIAGTGALLTITSQMEYCILHEVLHENLLEDHSEGIAGPEYSDGSSNRHTKICHVTSLLFELASKLSGSPHGVSYYHKAWSFGISNSFYLSGKIWQEVHPTYPQYLSGCNVSSLLECLSPRIASP